MGHVRKIRILLADDHKIVQDGIKLLLSPSSEMEVVHQVGNGREALDWLSENDIDLVLTDISMPILDGIALTTRIKQQYPHIVVLVLSMHHDTQTVSDAIHAEADGYVLKNTGREELLAAIRKVMHGGTYYSENIFTAIADGLKLERKRADAEHPLTVREIEVLHLVCDELTTAEIAEKLYLSPKTVETHRKNILRKTGAKSSIGLIKFALLHEIISLPG